MKRFPVLLTVLLVCGFFSMPTASHAENYMSSFVEQVPNAIDDVKPFLQFRPRYEWVDTEDDGGIDVANGLTVKTVVGAKVGSIFELEGLSAYIEATNVMTSLVDEYRTGSAADPHGHDSAENDVIADPAFTRISQAYLNYNIKHLTTTDTTIIAGRKFLVMDDHRHWGTVGWRQMPQSFGQIGIIDKTVPGLEAIGLWVYERRGIKQDTTPAGANGAAPFENNYEDGAAVFHLAYKIPTFLDGLKLGLTGYGYLIESLHDTYGGFVKAGYKITEDISVSWHGEMAFQTSPSLEAEAFAQPDVNARYYRGTVGAKAYGFFAKGELEVLGHGKRCGSGSGCISGYSRAFTTPHATLHKFNGWADVMVGQAAAGGNINGLMDTSLTAGYSSKYLGKLMFVFHDFRTETGNGNIASGDYGREYDILYKIGVTKRLSALAKAAFYDGDEGGADSVGGVYARDKDKVWLQLQYTYN